MRLVLTVVAVATSAASASPGFVSAGKPVRKAAPANLSEEALKAFVAGIIADKKGDLETAVKRYKDLNGMSPQANATYNLADVQRRMEHIADAVQSYRKYLELAPDASDRKAVEQLITELTTSPHVAVIDWKEDEGLVFVDGKLLGPSPQLVRMPEGKHVAARLTATGFNARNFESHPAATDHVEIAPVHERGAQIGNVVLSASGHFGTSGTWKDGGLTFELPGRFTLAPGHYSTWPWNDQRVCQPLTFDVPALGKNQVLFVYLDAQPNPRDPRGSKDSKDSKNSKDSKDSTCMPSTTRVQTITLPGASS